MSVFGGNASLTLYHINLDLTIKAMPVPTRFRVISACISYPLVLERLWIHNTRLCSLHTISASKASRNTRRWNSFPTGSPLWWIGWRWQGFSSSTSGYAFTDIRASRGQKPKPNKIDSMSSYLLYLRSNQTPARRSRQEEKLYTRTKLADG